MTAASSSPRRFFTAPESPHTLRYPVVCSCNFRHPAPISRDRTGTGQAPYPPGTVCNPACNRRYNSVMSAFPGAPGSAVFKKPEIRAESFEKTTLTEALRRPISRRAGVYTLLEITGAHIADMGLRFFARFEIGRHIVVFPFCPSATPEIRGKDAIYGLVLG